MGEVCKSVPGDESRFRVLGWERGAEFLNWGHLPMPEFRNLAGPGRSGPIVPHFLPTLSVRLCAGLAGPGRADSHLSGPHRRSENGPIPTLSVRLCAGRAGPGRADCSSHLSGQPKCDSLSTIIHILPSPGPSRGPGLAGLSSHLAGCSLGAA